MRQKREFKKIFGSDSDLIKVVHAIRMVKKNQIDEIIKDIARDQEDQEQLKHDHQMLQSKDTLRNKSQFMQSLK